MVNGRLAKLFDHSPFFHSPFTVLKFSPRTGISQPHSATRASGKEQGTGYGTGT
jgi:hypothetical protein